MSKINWSVNIMERWEKLHLLGMVLTGPILMAILGLIYFNFLYRPLI